MEHAPIVCIPEALTNPERERYRTLRSEFVASIRKSSPMPDGYLLEFEAGQAQFHHVAEWISLERKCCPFLSFELRWGAGDSSAPTLAISGPEGTKDFLETVRAAEID